MGPLMKRQRIVRGGFHLAWEGEAVIFPVGCGGSRFYCLDACFLPFFGLTGRAA